MDRGVRKTMTRTMRASRGRAGALLFFSSALWITTSAHAERMLRRAASPVVDTRAAARARFSRHLDSEPYLDRLDAKARSQLFGNLRARFAPNAPSLFARFAADAAMLLELASQSQHDPSRPPSYELAVRYGSKLILTRIPTPNDAKHGFSAQQLLLVVAPPHGSARSADRADLELFGITHARQFEALLGQAMDRLAPEDYE